MTDSTVLHAVRTTYDTVAADYARLLPDLSWEAPLDLAMLATFAESVRNAGPGPVADIGCGAGRVTEHLHSLGVEVFGIDLSSKMIDVARRTHPHLQFEVGSMTALDRRDRSLGGALAWYSIIHTAPEQLPAIFAEFFRVLVEGAQLLIGFQVGDERRSLTQEYGHDVSCDAYRLPADSIADQLSSVGFDVHTRVLRAAAGQEVSPQAILMARRPPRP